MPRVANTSGNLNNLELQASTYRIVAIKMFIYHTKACTENTIRIYAPDSYDDDISKCVINLSIGETWMGQLHTHTSTSLILDRI